MEPTTIPHVYPRGSRYGADGIEYPAEAERTVPLTGQALNLMLYLYTSLRHVFREHEDVYVGADQFIYWEPGNTHKCVAPDGYVILGVPRDPPRDVIRTWEDAVPDLVIEISSARSRAEDRGRKRSTYQDELRCPEYLVYDIERRDLLLYRLVNRKYRLATPEPDGRYHSRALGISFGHDPNVLVRVFGPDGEPAPETEEWATQVAVERQRADAEWARADTERQRADAERQRADAERQRADAASESARSEKAHNEQLSAELLRLQAEIERLKQGVSPGS